MRKGSIFIQIIFLSLLLSGTITTVSCTNSNSEIDYVANQASVSESLLFSTYLGGDSRRSGDDRGADLVVGSEGDVYCVIYSETETWPMVNAYYDSYLGGDSDIVLIKTNSKGTELLYSTFLGGNGLDFPYQMVVDDNENVYITGSTTSTDLATRGAFDESFNGDRDVFVIKINVASNVLHYATLIGGSDLDEANSLAVDADGNVYVTGITQSPDFPVESGIDENLNGTYDAFLFKLDSTGNMLFSTFIGGEAEERGQDLTLSDDGSIFVTGYTMSQDYPCTESALDDTLDGSQDAFLTKIASDGSEILFSTLIGGVGSDSGYCCTTDHLGYFYLAGSTRSTDFPTVNAWDDSHNGGRDNFVMKINPDGTGILYSTYLGGIDSEEPRGIAVDSWGCVFIGGATNSDDYPVANAYDVERNVGEMDAYYADCFLSKLDIANNRLLFSSYIGGSENDEPFRISLDADGNILFCGMTNSDDFDTTNDSLQEEYYGGGWDAFVVALYDRGDMDGDMLAEYQETSIGTERNNNDTDSDQMPDGWEFEHGLNPLVNDANLDNDGDGLLNLDEYLQGTDPNNIDSDGDGFPDGWESENGYSPNHPEVALEAILLYNLPLILIGCCAIGIIPILYVFVPKLKRDAIVEVTQDTDGVKRAFDELAEGIQDGKEEDESQVLMIEEKDVDLERLRLLEKRVDQLESIEHIIDTEIRNVLLSKGAPKGEVEGLSVEFLAKDRATLSDLEIQTLVQLQAMTKIPTPKEISRLLDARRILNSELEDVGGDDLE